MSTLQTTMAVPKPQRLAFWQELVANTYVPMTVRGSDAERFFGELLLEPIGCLTMSVIRSCRQDVATTRTSIRRSHSDYFYIIGQIAGRGTVRQDVHEANMQAGGWTIVDSTRPYELHFEDPFEQIVVAAPRITVPNLIRRSALLTGRDLSNVAPLGRMFSRYLSLLHIEAGTLTSETRPLLADSVLNLLAATVSEALREVDASRAPEPEQLARIRAFIAEHLRDPDLRVGTVARAFRISTRYVHKLFEAQGVTLSEYVRRQRLEHCCRDLLSERNRGLSITQIALHWGFNSPAHFSGLFREYYGMPASEYRRRHAGDPAAAAPAPRASRPQ
jgi:AraC-like DNA-binding protein